MEREEEQHNGVKKEKEKLEEGWRRRRSKRGVEKE